MKIPGIFFILFSISIFSCQSSDHSLTKPVAQKGIIDLKNWDFEKDGSIMLNGEWEFYWHKLLESCDFSNQRVSSDGYYPVPSYWNGMKVNGKEVQAEGFATFRLKIVCHSRQKLEIAIPDEMTSYKFWFDGQLIFSCGKVSSNAFGAIPRELPVIKEIELTKDSSELIFQVSNYHHRVGGLIFSPKLGTSSRINNEQISKVAFDIFLFGSILIMALYHFGLFFMRRENKATLYFGLFTLVLAIRTLFTGTMFITILFPGINWFIKYRIEYLTMFLAPIFIVSFLQRIYDQEINKRFTKIYTWICIVYALTCIFPPSVFTRLLLSFQLLILLVMIYLFIALIRVVRHKRYGSRILFASIIVLFISIINDILLNQGIITNSMELAPFGTFIFILGQSFVLAKIFTGAFYENEILTMELDDQNKNLERTIELRTWEVEKQKVSILEINEELTLQNEEIQSINESLELQRQQLIESEAKFRGLVELLPEAIFEIDEDGKIIYANDEFFSILDYRPEDLNKGLNINHLLIQDKTGKDSSLTDKIKEILPENKVLKEMEFLIKKKGNYVFPILLSLAQVFERGKTFYRCVFVDISQRVEHEGKIKNVLHEIRKQNKDITDSIHYALTIQNAILPSTSFIATLFDDFFILNKPHSIVSGDFYYFSKIGKHIIFALADCTGHGVPGGFMTMLGITQLHDIYSGGRLPSPEYALGIMRKQIIENLGQDMDEYGSKDGIEIFLGILDTETLSIEYASANQPMYVMRKGNLMAFKGERMPVGIYRRMEEFNHFSFQLKKGDIIYLFSDGVPDLFGGEKERRLNTDGVKEIIQTCYEFNLTDQGRLIEKFLARWQGDNKQTDDMLMIGLKI